MDKGIRALVAIGLGFVMFLLIGTLEEVLAALDGTSPNPAIRAAVAGVVLAGCVWALTKPKARR